MLLIRLLHLLTGYVVFTAAGGFPERFVNLCAGMRIPVWDVRPCGDSLRGKTEIRAYRRLRAAARRAGMRLRIVEKRGLPFFLHRRRDRYGLLIGAGVFLLILFALSSRIWMIEIEGTDLLTEDAVRAALAEMRIAEGMAVRALDASDAERELVRLLPRVNWAALNVDGSVLHVTVRENEALESENDPPPCHIVAARDGFLKKIEAYEGQQIAQPNTAVQQGELLISGVKEHTRGTTLHHASGYAEAQTVHNLACRLPRRAYPAASRKRFRIALEFFGVHVPLGDPRAQAGAQFFSYAQYAAVGGKRLPLSYVVYRSTFYAGAHRLTDAQSRLLLRSDFGRQAAAELRGAQILRAKVRLRDGVCAGTFVLLENIALEKEIPLADSQASAADE
ncbi:MAG: sporulation protein YqfD [Clostridia bacterium]|nr:sporulation protein YqfD [Clostridia bacterium]